MQFERMDEIRLQQLLQGILIVSLACISYAPPSAASLVRLKREDSRNSYAVSAKSTNRGRKSLEAI